MLLQNYEVYKIDKKKNNIIYKERQNFISKKKSTDQILTPIFKRIPQYIRYFNLSLAFKIFKRVTSNQIGDIFNKNYF